MKPKCPADRDRRDKPGDDACGGESTSSKYKAEASNRHRHCDTMPFGGGALGAGGGIATSPRLPKTTISVNP
jgi:hypothetical protein